MSEAEKDKDKHPYIAVKVKGHSHWMWFHRDNVVDHLGVFCGSDGWGEGGALTSIKIRSEEIEGRIESEKLQYRS